MKIKNIVLLFIMFGLIAVSIFFSSNPFNQEDDYNCLQQQVNVTICNEVNGTDLCTMTTQQQNVNICGAVNDTRELSIFKNDLEFYQPKPSTSGGLMPLSIGTPIADSNGMCSYNDALTCQGANVSNGLITGKRYLVKQVYENKTAICDTNIRATYYFKDCTQGGLLPNVCSANRCVKYPFQNLFYQIMERIGFR